MKDDKDKKKKVLTVSFVIPTYNSDKTLSECLSSIRTQEYPENAIEIILADGGSQDKTFALAKKYNAHVVNITSDKQGAEYNRAIGAHKAKNDILVFLDHDNILPHKKWLTNMIQPLLDHKEVVGVETLRYGYNKSESLLGRYFSLFCVNDVVPFYLGKADRLSYMYDSLDEYGTFQKAKIRNFENYFLVDFNKKHIPTLGSNGFLICRNILFTHANSDPENFFHIDVNVDLIRKGYSTYAFVKDDINHATEERGLVDYVNRRRLFVEKYHFQDSKRRRYSVYEDSDKLKLILFVFYAVTFIKPLLDSVRGYVKIRDIAWFLNPIVSFLMVVVYSYSVVKYGFKKKLLSQ